MDSLTQLWAVPLIDTLGFMVKAFVVFATITATAVVVFALARRTKDSEPHLTIKRVNDRFEHLANTLRASILDNKAMKAFTKQYKKDHPKAAQPKENLFVIDFKGDVSAAGVDDLRHEVSAIIDVAGKGDEVLLRLESPGGVVHGYGLGASQLVRLKNSGIRLVACVDKVAASGGYMMASVADEILAAPFAILGSIGVAAPVPNLHRLLERAGVDYDNMTAGEYKRTVSFFAKITDQGRKKFQEQLDETHDLFKAFVHEQRPSLAIDTVATGEHWLATRALELGLVDRTITSDDYLMQRCTEANLYEVHYQRPKTWRDTFTDTTTNIVDAVVTRLWTRILSAHLSNT